MLEQFSQHIIDSRENQLGILLVRVHAPTNSDQYREETESGWHLCDYRGLEQSLAPFDYLWKTKVKWYQGSIKDGKPLQIEAWYKANDKILEKAQFFQTG